MASLGSLALRNVRRQRRRSLLTMAVVALGMLAVMVLRGASAGLTALMMEEVIDGRTGAIQVHRTGYVSRLDAVPTDLAFELTPELRDQLTSTPGVQAISGRLRFDGLVSNGSLGLPLLGRGVELASEAKVCPAFGHDVRAPGRLIRDGAEAMLGLELGVALGLSTAGGEVTLSATSPDGRLNAVDVRAVGLSSLRLPFENKRSVVVPLEFAQQLLGLRSRVTEVAIAVTPGADVEKVSEELRKRVGPQLEVHTWRQLEPWVNDTLRRQNTAIDVVAAVLLLIVLSSIGSTTTMAVHERTAEIGTLLALGVRRRQVRQLILVEACVLGGGGALLGGVVGATLVATLGHLGVPVHVLATEFILRPVVDQGALVTGVLACIVGTVLSAWTQARRAANLDPVAALRAL